MTCTLSHTTRLLHLPLPLSEITFPLFSGWWITPRDSDFNASVCSPVKLFLQKAPLLVTWANLVASTYHTFLVFPTWPESRMRAGVLSSISSNLPRAGSDPLSLLFNKRIIQNSLLFLFLYLEKSFKKAPNLLNYIILQHSSFLGVIVPTLHMHYRCALSTNPMRCVIIPFPGLRTSKLC